MSRAKLTCLPLLGRRANFPSEIDPAERTMASHGAQSTDSSSTNHEEAANHLPGGELYRQMVAQASNDKPRRDATVLQWLCEWEREWAFSGAHENSPP